MGGGRGDTGDFHLPLKCALEYGAEKADSFASGGRLRKVSHETLEFEHGVCGMKRLRIGKCQMFPYLLLRIDSTPWVDTLIPQR